MFKKLSTVSLLSAVFLLSACSSDSDEATPPEATPGIGNSVYDNIYNDTNLSTLLAAIDAAGLANTLDDESAQFTVFAPNNAAFTAFEDSNPDDDAIAALLADPTTLSSILTYHVLSGTTDAADAIAAAADGPVALTTVNGATVTLGASDTAGSGLAIGGADIVTPDSNYTPETSVGVVHVISAVLVPPSE